MRAVTPVIGGLFGVALGVGGGIGLSWTVRRYVRPGVSGRNMQYVVATLTRYMYADPRGMSRMIGVPGIGVQSRAMPKGFTSRMWCESSHAAMALRSPLTASVPCELSRNQFAALN